MKKADPKSDEMIALELDKQLNKRTQRSRVPTLFFTPNMAAASRSHYDSKPKSCHINDEDELPRKRANHRAENLEQRYPLAASDYIEIYSKGSDKWLAATVLEMLTKKEMLVCYDYGEYVVENIAAIEFQHISKQPPKDDLIFEHNNIEYFIPKGKCEVRKTMKFVGDNACLGLNILANVAISPRLCFLASSAAPQQTIENPLSRDWATLSSGVPSPSL